MADAFIGEIKAFPYNFTPKNWATCNGALLSISQNQALFSLLGTTYGGNGVQTFGLPDLQGRAPVHFGTDSSGQSFPIGGKAGEENVTLIVSTLPSHSHAMRAVGNTAGNQSNANNGLPAKVGVVGSNPTVNIYGAPSSLVTLAGDTISGGGTGGAHSNMQPYQVFNFCICVAGIFPSRS